MVATVLVSTPERAIEVTPDNAPDIETAPEIRAEPLTASLLAAGDAEVFEYPIVTFPFLFI